jgi:hypothetical protein
VGILTVDITTFGVVMTADSQPIEALDGQTRVLAQPGQRRKRDPILRRTEGGFSGFIGFVGTETIANRGTRDWLTTFGRRHAGESLPDYVRALRDELTAEWHRHGMNSVLEILITGVLDDGDVQFWFVRNSDGLYDRDGTYRAPRADFVSANDLDDNYVPPSSLPKEDFLRTRLLSFRQGALVPATIVFDSFGQILEIIRTVGVPGFNPISSVDDLGYFARQRLEFMKRLYSDRHGVYQGGSAPIGGDVHVYGVARDGVMKTYPKIRSQAREI